MVPSITDAAGSLLNGAIILGQFGPWGQPHNPEFEAYAKALNNVNANTRDPNVMWAYAETLFIYDAAKKIGFAKFTSASLDKFMNTTKSFPVPLSHNMVNPGPAAAPQIKQPYVRIEQWQNGRILILPVGPKKDGWINGW